MHAKLRTRALLAALLGASLAGCVLPPHPAQAPQATVIRNTTIVDTRDGALRRGVSVLIEQGRIARITPGAMAPAPASAQVVDGTGKYLVPSYLDMHAHMLDDAHQQPQVWPLLVANGVTGVQEMSGSAATVRRARQVNAESRAGRLLAPEILRVPGVTIVSARTAEQGRQQVRDNQALGGDFVKLLNASPEATRAALDEARQRHLPVVGHLPLGITGREAARLGWRSFEHLGAGLGLLLECSTDEDAIRRQALQNAPPPFVPEFIANPIAYAAADLPLYRRLVDSYSEERCRALVQALARSGSWQAPTLVRLRTMLLSNDPRYASDPRLIYMPGRTRALWARANQRYVATHAPEAVRTLAQVYARQQHLVGLMQAHGVPLMTGSDLGGIWVLPGYGLHDEFAELAAAGLTPLQVLQAATLNGARYLGREASMGTVDEGKNADLVLLDANPLESVAHLARISAVVLQGRYLPRRTLDALLQAAAQGEAGPPVAEAGPLPGRGGHRH